MQKETAEKSLEGYPIEPKTENYTPAFAYTGLASAFRHAGFHRGCKAI